MKTLLVDNYDSFSYNIYQMLSDIDQNQVTLVKNDLCNWEKIDFSLFDNIVISPGPGHPDNTNDFGLCKKLIARINKPLLGICLGHQGIVSAFGGAIVRSKVPIHGQIHALIHYRDPLFSKIPTQFQAVRYHSLIARQDLPNTLAVICETQDATVMGVKHKKRPIYGVQFHPESIGSEYGSRLFQNFHQITARFYQKHPQLSTLRRSQTNSFCKRIKHQSESNPLCKRQYQLRHTAVDFYGDTASLFTQIHQHDKQAIWLDSSIANHDMAHISIIALSSGPLSQLVSYSLARQSVEITSTSEKQVLQNTSIWDYLDHMHHSAQVSAPDFPFDFQCGWVGYLGYELKKEVLPVAGKHSSPFDDAKFLFSDRAVLIDHRHQKAYLLALDLDDQFQPDIDQYFKDMKHKLATISAVCTTSNLKVPLEDIVVDPYLEMPKAQYLQAISQCMDYIKAGESYEICLTNRIRIPAHIDPLAYYLILRAINPAPYAAFMPFDAFCIASASIERFLKIDTSGWVETKPIKGTLPRALCPVADKARVKTLQQDQKFISENLMIVDLLRNDLGKFCEIGSIYVPKLMAVESYKTVHQLVSTIRGKKRADCSPIDCIKACFPGGSMTGAPKIRTLRIIDALESSARGIYSGAIGFLSLNGALDLNVVIRTAVITPHCFTVSVGGAIITLSDPQQEYDEMQLKAHALMRALNHYLKQ